MQHYKFDNSHLPIMVRVPIHIIIAVSLSVIALKVFLTSLDFFQIGILWLQSNSDLGMMIAVLVLIISFLVFDSLLMPLTDTGGFLTSLYTSIKEEYDVQVYIRREYATTVDELDYIRENFAKSFDLESFCEFTEADKALEGILLSKRMEVIPNQVENMRMEMLNFDIPEVVNVESIVEVNIEFPGTIDIESLAKEIELSEGANTEPLEEIKTESLEEEVNNPEATDIKPLEEVDIEPEIDLGVIENFDEILEGVNIVNGPPIDLGTFGDFGKPLENINVKASPNDITERLRMISITNQERIDAEKKIEKASAKFPSKMRVKFPSKSSDSSPDNENGIYSDMRKLREKQEKL